MEDKLISILKWIFRFIKELPGKLWSFYRRLHGTLLVWLEGHTNIAAHLIELLLLAIAVLLFFLLFTRPSAAQPEMSKVTKIDTKLVIDKKHSMITIGIILILLIIVASVVEK